MCTCVYVGIYHVCLCDFSQQVNFEIKISEVRFFTKVSYFQNMIQDNIKFVFTCQEKQQQQQTHTIFVQYFIKLQASLNITHTILRIRKLSINDYPKLNSLFLNSVPDQVSFLPVSYLTWPHHTPKSFCNLTR